MVTVELLEAQSREVTDSKGLVTGKPLYLSESCFQELNQVLTVNPLVLLVGEREKQAFWNPWEFYVLSNVCSQEKLFNQSLTCWGFKSEPNWPKGRDDIPSSSWCWSSCPTDRVGVRSTCKVHSPEAQAHWKTETSSQDHFPSPHTSSPHY